MTIKSRVLKMEKEIRPSRKRTTSFAEALNRALERASQTKILWLDDPALGLNLNTELGEKLHKARLRVIQYKKKEGL